MSDIDDLARAAQAKRIGQGQAAAGDICDRCKKLIDAATEIPQIWQQQWIVCPRCFAELTQPGPQQVLAQRVEANVPPPHYGPYPPTPQPVVYYPVVQPTRRFPFGTIALIVIGCMVCMCCLWPAASVFVGTAKSTQSRSPSPSQPPPPASPPVRVGAIELVEAYAQNELAADNLYKGRTLAVEGRIDAVRRDILNKAYVTLEGPSGTFRSVQCYFDQENESQATGIGKGQYVIVVGHCDGMFGNVSLKHCQVVVDLREKSR